MFVVACLLVPALAAAQAGAQPAPEAQPTLADIAVRDQLIADQESLLNTYRCLFGVDTHVVPGGCADGQPSGGRTQPGTFDGTPVQSDVDVRDQLIANQEALLNVYRCQFDIDTQLVPGGCDAEEPDAVEPDAEEADVDDPAPGAFVAVSALGVGQTCALRGDQTIECWGDTLYGLYDSSGVGVAPEGRFAAISTGNTHLCGIRVDGTAVCWGNNFYGQALEAPSGQFAAVSAGSTHSCGIRADSTAVCWGRNHRGQADAPAGRFTAISAGSAFSCGIRVAGTIACWGYDGNGQASPPEGQFTAIAAGVGYSCAIRIDGSIACWGDGSAGQADPPEGEFTAITASGFISCGDGCSSFGTQHSCAIRVDSTVACWGAINYFLGPNPPTSSQVLPPDGEFTSISTGFVHSCGITPDGNIVCWGQEEDTVWGAGSSRMVGAPDGVTWKQ